VIVIVQEEEKPEPEEAVLHDTATRPGKSGFDFSAAEIVDWRDESADMFFSSSSEGPEFIVRKDADIQDVGQAGSFLRLETAPMSEWSPAHRVHAEVRNVYVVWTWDNQYFKFRVISVSDGRASIEWMKMEGGSRVASSVLHRNGEMRRDNTLAKFGR
jgi:hypothetical protein